tara:strand:- start:151 stop:747 length:597 start_codon:yes stop_codon:yes gene_type:complete
MQKNSFNYLEIFIALIFISFATSCGIYKPSDARKVSPNVEERVQKSIEEGKGIRFGLGKGSKETHFEFSSSNELWRATLDILDFLPLSNVDYSGGIIITDWYNEGTAPNESIKITVRFLSNEIRSDGLDIVIHKRICKGSTVNCNVKKITSGLEEEIKLAILRKATILQKKGDKKRKEKNKGEYEKKYGKALKDRKKN